MHYDEKQSRLMSFIILAAIDDFIIQSILEDETIPINEIVDYMIC